MDMKRKWSFFALLISGSVLLSGCAFIALRSEYVRGAIRQDVDGIEARFNLDDTGTCRSPYSSLDVSTKTGVRLEAGRPTCMVVKFRPNVSDLDRRLELANAAIDASPRLLTANVDKAVVKQANVKMLSQDRRYQLDPADFIIPAFVCLPDDLEFCK